LDVDKIVADLKHERDRLSRAIVALEGAGTSGAGTTSSASAARPAVSKKKKRGGLTPEGRRRLSESMKRRWAERRRKGR
jgi:hypothetical protein